MRVSVRVRACVHVHLYVRVCVGMRLIVGVSVRARARVHERVCVPLCVCVTRLGAPSSGHQAPDLTHDRSCGSSCDHICVHSMLI